MASVKKNLIYNMSYQVLILILPLITTPYISRVLGAEGLGVYSFYQSIALYFVYFSMLGVLNYGNREISKSMDSKEKTKEKFSEIYSMQLVTSILFLILYIVFAVIFPKIGEKQIALIFSLQVFSATIDISWLFFGVQEFKIPAIIQMFSRLFSFGLIFIFVKNINDLWKYVLIMASSYIISLLPLLYFRKKRITAFSFTLKNVKKHLMSSLILFIPIIATSIFRLMDKIMIGIFGNIQSVGYYENAEKLITISLGVVASFGAVMMPKITNLHSNGKRRESVKLISRSIEVSIWFGTAVCFGIIATANDFIPMFFGNEFERSIPIAKLLSFSAIMISWSAIIRLLYLIPFEKDKVYVKSVVVGAVINFVSNLILIPHYQEIGAVIGTLLAEGFIVVYQSYAARKTVFIWKHLCQLFIFSLMGVLMIIVSNLLVIIHIPWDSTIIKVLICGMFYFIFSIIYFLFVSDNKKDNLNIILKIIKKFKVIK